MNTIVLSLLRLLSSIIVLCMLHAAQAGSPVWTFTPLTATTVAVPANDTVTIQYQVSNQSTKPHTLNMQPILAITQLTAGPGICSNPFTLAARAACTLSLEVNGSQLTSPINNGPIVCEQGSSLQCYRPAANNILHITQTPAITNAMISVTGSPLILTTNGPIGILTIQNDSLMVTATGITSDFTGTALDGNVTQTGNTCATLAPQAACTLTYTPGNTVVPQTDFTIQGANTDTATAAIAIQQGMTINTVTPAQGPAIGGTGVTLTGTGFVAPIVVTFGNSIATSVNVVNSTTITAVTPAHAVGAVDVVITKADGSSATATNGYTYLTTAVGQSAYGGTIACLNSFNNLIAATVDNSTSIKWGSAANLTGANSISNGLQNTSLIVNCLTNTSTGLCPGNLPIDTYAAGICSTYEVDSQGNTPCQPGNACYNDWFLPAGNSTSNVGQLQCLYTNRDAIHNFSNQLYWSSTEFDNTTAWAQDFANGAERTLTKTDTYHVRCVRQFL